MVGLRSGVRILRKPFMVLLQMVTVWDNGVASLSA